MIGFHFTFQDYRRMHSVTAPTMMMANQVTAARPHVLGIGNAGFVGF